MYISKNLIKMLLKQIDNLDDQALSEAFVNSGIEVDSIIKPQPINNLTVGKILEIKKHPNADKLNICKVQLDDSTTSDIVCGATNVEINRKVIVALEGAKLPNGLEIKTFISANAIVGIIIATKLFNGFNLKICPISINIIT